MKPALLFLPAVLLAPPAAPAATILVTGQASVTLRQGDALEFQFGAWNYANYAGQPYPARISFMFSTAPVGAAGPVFGASLESADGAASVKVTDPLRFRSGQMKATYYAGPVSVLVASTAITPDQAAALFGPDAGKQALVVLQNLGDPITLGLPNYAVAQMLGVSLMGPSLSVGAPGGDVFLSAADASADDAPHAPEPGTLVLALPALAGACAWRLWRRSKRS